MFEVIFDNEKPLTERVSSQIVELVHLVYSLITSSKLNFFSVGLTFIRDKHKLASDMQDIRVMIEPQSAAMAATRATPDDVAEMRRLCAQIEHMAPLGEDYQEYDVELHTCIARSTQNIVVPNLIPIINKGISLFMDLSNRAFWSDTLKHHREVVDAIERHDPDTARNAMLCHTMLNRQCMESIAKKATSAQ